MTARSNLDFSELRHYSSQSDFFHLSVNVVNPSHCLNLTYFYQKFLCY